MSLKDKAAQEAHELMERTNPKCPNCGAKGQWKYDMPQILNKHDLETGTTGTSLIVRIECAKCKHEMPHFELSGQ